MPSETIVRRSSLPNYRGNREAKPESQTWNQQTALSLVPKLKGVSSCDGCEQEGGAPECFDWVMVVWCWNGWEAFGSDPGKVCAEKQMFLGCPQKLGLPDPQIRSRESRAATQQRIHMLCLILRGHPGSTTLGFIYISI